MFKKKTKDVVETAKEVYNYHNLGVGIFPEGEEKTPHGSGERYNFDRMYFFVSNYDFYGKNILDIGCNSGWFCFQSKLLGASNTVGIDCSKKGIMGTALQYAYAVEEKYRLGMKFYDQNLEHYNPQKVLKDVGIEVFDAVFLLSVLHHIKDKKKLVTHLYEHTRDVIFYEDEEFWNELYDANGEPVKVSGEGFRFGWNEDMSWQRKMMPIETIEQKVIEKYRNSPKAEWLLLDRYKKIELLGLSEKRRPVFAFWI